MKHVLTIIVFTVIAIGCRKKQIDEPEPNILPTATQNGANLLACKINGAVHIYSGIPGRIGTNGVSFTKVWGSNNEQYVLISAGDSKYGDQLDIDIYEPGWNIQVKNDYKFSNENKVKAKYFYADVFNEYKTQSNSGYISFTRYDDRVVAGNFSFKVFNKTDSVKTIEGFFDIAVTQ
jgi:hypothetical protein